ncbi:hypothetical protein [Novosphingobium sp.]|uniref:hypothetical protein n=1 Tax=Novosphingobium sp. TaxID=1874826 RepID=UPI002622A815|nr:hypothetical protein [Novosphingobium sp.]
MLTTSRHFQEWLASAQHSLAFTTYRADKAFFIGVKPDGKLSVFEGILKLWRGLANKAMVPGTESLSGFKILKCCI